MELTADSEPVGTNIIEIPSAPKPWIIAGFPTRAAWRASKAKPAPAVIALAIMKKKPAKKKAQVKAKSKAKSVKTDREPSARQQKLLVAFKGQARTLQELGDAAYPSETKARRNSWARNNVRWLLREKFVKRVKPGTYAPK